MNRENTAQSAQKSGMARLLEIAATKKPLIISALIFSALASIASFVPYLCIYAIIREVLRVFPDVAAMDAGRAVGYGWLAFGGVAANILLYFAALMCSHLAAFGTLYELKVNFATHLARVPLGFHLMQGSGKLRKIMDENIEGFIAHQLPDIVAGLVAPVVMLVILFAVDWRLAIAAVLGMLLALFIQIKAFTKENAKEMMGQYQNTLEEMNNASVEYIRGMSVVKAFKQTVYSFCRLRDTIAKYTAVVIPYTLGWQNYMSAFSTLINNLYLPVLPVGIFILMRTDDPGAFIGSFIFYLLFLPAAAGILMKVMYVSSNGIQILGGVEAMDRVLAHPELPQPETDKAPGGYDIRFEDVLFSYEGGGGAHALDGVSFTAKQKQVTAIVGPSGGGKSTIAHLIPRFFDVTEGAVTIGGVDIRQMRTASLMQKVGFVFQDVYLFKQSVRENIRMGNPSATDAQIEAAAKAAQCHEFVSNLPDGYDTVIGTKGVHLSGGEQQRLAIARAIVKDTPIVVLDEATAFADPENEHLIQKAFETLMQNKTVILIAHRLSTVRSADKILVVEQGKVTAQGTHEELLKQGGRYKTMWETYSATSKWTMTDKEKERDDIA